MIGAEEDERLRLWSFVKMREKMICLLIFTALWVVLLPVPSLAGQDPARDQVAVVLILDNSGSMKGNDPQGLRFMAARLFLALLDPGDLAGVILFSTESRTLTPELISIGKRSEQEGFSDTGIAHELAGIPPDGYTDIKAALEDARILLEQADHTRYRLVVLLLTDGKPEIAEPYPQYEAEALDLAGDFHTPVLAIALTREAETPFLNRLAAQTGGLVWPAEEPADLLDAYLQIFGEIKDRIVIGDGTSAAPGWAGLDLDEGLAPFVERASFLVVKPESVQAKLLSPGGQALESLDLGGISQVEDPNFQVITVERPAGGNWGFDLQGDGSVQARAILRSRLRLQVEVPGTGHPAGQPLPIRVRMVEEQEDGSSIRVVGQASFSNLITRPDGQKERLDRFYDDGSNGDVQAGDGEFTRLYTAADLPGTYLIHVQGWKGVASLESSARVSVISFPSLLIDEPQERLYEVRGEPLWLRAHLAGAGSENLDQGELVAVIKTPKGEIEKLQLIHDGDTYAGSFLPLEDGLYELTIEPSDASYMGLPYHQSVTTWFEVKIVPALAIQKDVVRLGRREIAELVQGIPLTIPYTSTGRRSIPLDVHLEGIPQMKLASVDEIWALPGQTGLVSLSLSGSQTILPGSYHGWLVFTASEGIDLVHPRLPLQIEVYQPALTFSNGTLDPENHISCLGAERIQLRVPVLSTSEKPENLTFALGRSSPGLSTINLTDEIQLFPRNLEVPPGSSEVLLDLTYPAGVPEGNQLLHLHVQGREGLAIQPQPPIELRFQAPGFWARCRKPVVGGSVSLLVFAAGSLLVIRKVRSANEPPQVTGTLRHWPVDRPASAQEIDLTSLKKQEVSIGSGRACDICIQDASLGEVHAILQAERIAGQERMMLRPVEQVRMHYRTVRQPLPLHHGDLFALGEKAFRYLSDEGI